MSTADFKLAEEPIRFRHGAPTVIFCIGFAALLPTAALFGGMEFLLLVLAVGLALIVWVRPQEAPGAGMLFLFAAGILLPYGARFDVDGDIWQMYYWAAGLLIITVSAVLRLGIGRVWQIPLSAKVFLLVALTAACYGITHQESASYVLRQLYGVVLLIAYLAIGICAGNQELLLKRIRTFGVLCALCFFVYYAAVFSEYGFHKEMGFNGTQASLLAAFLFLCGLERRKRRWMIEAIVILVVALLIFMRKDFLSFVVVLPIAWAMKSQSTRTRIACGLVVGLITLISLFPPLTEVIADELLKTPVIGKLLPPGVQDASTLIGRTAQLEATMETIQTHPWLGVGMGGELEIVDPLTHVLHIQLYEDNGWGYLLQKMGLVGGAAFVWLLVTVLSSFSRHAVALSACILSAILVTMFSEPVFFHFTTAPFLGTYAGLLFSRKQRFRFLKARLQNAPAALPS